MELSDLFFCLLFIEIILLDKVQEMLYSILIVHLYLYYLSLLGEIKQRQQQQQQQQSSSGRPVFLFIEVFVYFPM